MALVRSTVAHKAPDQVRPSGTTTAAPSKDGFYLARCAGMRVTPNGNPFWTLMFFALEAPAEGGSLPRRGSYAGVISMFPPKTMEQAMEGSKNPEQSAEIALANNKALLLSVQDDGLAVAMEKAGTDWLPVWDDENCQLGISAVGDTSAVEEGDILYAVPFRNGARWEAVCHLYAPLSLEERLLSTDANGKKKYDNEHYQIDWISRENQPDAASGVLPPPDLYTSSVKKDRAGKAATASAQKAATAAPVVTRRAAAPAAQESAPAAAPAEKVNGTAQAATQPAAQPKPTARRAPPPPPPVDDDDVAE